MTNTDASAHHKPLVFVIEALTVGGAEQMLVAMANRFVERGQPVHVVCLTQWGELAENLDPRIQKHLLDKRPGFDAQLPGKIRRLIRGINPSAVNSHLFTANLWTRIALLFSGVTVVVTEHNRDEWKSRLYRTLDRVFIRACYRLVAVSNDTADFYCDDVGLPSEKVEVINNGIDAKRYAAGNGAALRETWLSQYAGTSQPDECVFVGTVGRLASAKNHSRLLDAAALWKHTAPQVRTLIVGDGELADEVDKKIDALDLEEHVFRLGTRHDIPDVLAALDMFVLSSDREGHPLTALEAQAAGTPVVLTDAGGSKDAIAQSDNQSGGVLVEKEVTAFAEAVAELASNDEKRLAMSQFAKSYALKHFDLDQMVDQYASVFWPEDHDGLVALS